MTTPQDKKGILLKKSLKSCLKFQQGGPLPKDLPERRIRMRRREEMLGKKMLLMFQPIKTRQSLSLEG
jgi:hypothetical protein